MNTLKNTSVTIPSAMSLIATTVLLLTGCTNAPQATLADGA